MATTPLDFAGDLSVERRWRDSQVAAGGFASPRSSGDLQHSARQDSSLSRGGSGGGGGAGGDRRGDTDGGGGQKPQITVTTGGGGPTVAPGSYAEIFMEMQRRERSIPTVNDGSVLAPATAKTDRATSAARNKEMAAHHQQHHGGRTSSVSQLAAAAHVESAHPPSRRGNASAAPDTVAKADAAPTSSLLSYRGMSRAERGAARRQAWNQARQEGVLCDAGVGAHRKQRRKTSFRKATKGLLGGGDAARNKRGLERARSLEPPMSSARGRSLVSQGLRGRQGAKGVQNGVVSRGNGDDAHEIIGMAQACREVDSSDEQ